MLLLAPLASHIPKAALAGLLLLAAFRMVDYKQFIFHLRATRFDAGIVIATALAAVFVSIEFCIFIGVFLSFVFYVPRAAQVRLVTLSLKSSASNTSLRELPLLFSLEGELFFGAATEIERHLGTIDRGITGTTKGIVLFLRRARNPDAGFLTLLEKFHWRLHERKIALVLCGVQPGLAGALRATGLDAQIGPENIILGTADSDTGMREGVLRCYAMLGMSAAIPEDWRISEEI
jgi:sulfate permease, SulP family